jgi:hypothetical protein
LASSKLYVVAGFAAIWTEDRFGTACQPQAVAVPPRLKLERRASGSYA